MARVFEGCKFIRSVLEGIKSIISTHVSKEGKKPHMSEGSLQELATKEYGILFQSLAV
jgi:hypothetical protein